MHTQVATVPLLVQFGVVPLQTFCTQGSVVGKHWLFLQIMLAPQESGLVLHTHTPLEQVGSVPVQVGLQVSAASRPAGGPPSLWVVPTSAPLVVVPQRPRLTITSAPSIATIDA